jgi:peptide/nickel transport system substrate-binding protein
MFKYSVSKYSVPQSLSAAFLTVFFSAFLPVFLAVFLSLSLGACGGSQQVPRQRTLILDCVDLAACSGQFKDYDSFNPYIPGQVSRTGYNFLYEPLYFYNAYRGEDGVIPWIATGHQYNEDYTQVTIGIRPDATWSDGEPWTAHDLVFTINMLKANAPELSFSVDMDTWVEEAIALDDHTARITLKAPNPRFIFSYFTHNFDNGIPIVPKHIWEKAADPTTFTNFDLKKNWPVISGPYSLAYSEPQQRVWDLRPDWWAAQAGFKALPKVERLIYLPYMEESKQVQNLVTNHMDLCADMLPSNIKTVLEQNPKISTWSGKEPPYGYLDWWPLSLGFNAQAPPFDDAEIRWAINHAIDRNQIVEVGWQGAGAPTQLPFPDFPALRGYIDDVDDLLKKYPVDDYDPQKTASILRRKGWAKDQSGVWHKDGKPFKLVIEISPTFQDITPVLVEQFKRAGFDAHMRMTSDNYTRMSTGEAKLYIFGNGGSVRDPYFTLRLYHSRFAQPTGTATPTFWRWANTDFDAVVDQMGRTAPDDPQTAQLFRQALEVWLPQLPAIPLLQFYHRLPHNYTYWKNWPTAENPYINSAYWHRTWLLVLLQLEPTQD